jgi:hypothetical protein
VSQQGLVGAARWAKNECIEALLQQYAPPLSVSEPETEKAVAKKAVMTEKAVAKKAVMTKKAVTKKAVTKKAVMTKKAVTKKAVMTKKTVTEKAQLPSLSSSRRD